MDIYAAVTERIIEQMEQGINTFYFFAFFLLKK